MDFSKLARKLNMYLTINDRGYEASDIDAILAVFSPQTHMQDAPPAHLSALFTDKT